MPIYSHPLRTRESALLYGWRGFGGLDGARVNAARMVPSDGTIDDDERMSHEPG
ncbi:MAG: hypothetical protein ACSHX3_11450 [Litorimonas sp.]